MQLDDLLVSVSDTTLGKLLKTITGTAEKGIGIFYGTFGKIPRFELTEKVKQQATQEGLYHFVRNDEVADIILQSQHLRPSDNITSYGKKCVFTFCGAPSVDNYAKNLTDTNSLKKNKLWDGQINPYVNPTAVATALRFKPQMKDLANYTFRGLQDGAFMYEGFCILPPNAVEKLKMVPDLVRDSSGFPVKDDKGEYQVAFREASPEELSQDGKTYSAKPDYLEFMKEKRIEYGYLHSDGSNRSKLITKKVAFDDLARMEFDESLKNISKNGSEIVTGIADRIRAFFTRKPEIAKSAEENLQDFNFRKKNPYRDKKFALSVAKFQAEEGLSQMDLHDVLSDFTQSEDGEFFDKKYKQIEGAITKSGIHGKDHANRVALTAMMIARNEGVLTNDEDNRIKDILATAAMYHDIGRVLDNGPHAARGARKIAKMDLRYSNGKEYSAEDKKIVMALVQAHEGKPDKIDKMIKKYGIQSQENIDIARRLNSIVRDADALDRVRIDSNIPFSYKVNLNPKYLVNDTSKRLINSAYQLEFLTKKEPNIFNVLRYGKHEMTASDKMAEQSKEFNDRIIVDKVSTIEHNITSQPNEKQVEKSDKAKGFGDR